jgi:hypothetical protein
MTKPQQQFKTYYEFKEAREKKGKVDPPLITQDFIRKRKRINITIDPNTAIRARKIGRGNRSAGFELAIRFWDEMKEYRLTHPKQMRALTGEDDEEA